MGAFEALRWRPSERSARQHGGHADLFGHMTKGTTGVQRGADHLVADAFGHGHRFTGQH